uniref:Uncharacterized protein n=1 Tax=Salix viminalis TaxID=40686 RepID=A0A6N2KRX3_SALVM
MLCSCSRVRSLSPSHETLTFASFLLSKHLSFNSRQAILPSLHKSPVSLISLSLRTERSRPLLGYLRFNHSMASQSSPQSVHDFTVTSFAIKMLARC